MASYSIIKNTELVVNLLGDYGQQGWVVSENIAYHSGCNAGYIRSQLDLSTATDWTFTYEILDITSGTVNIVVDGVNGLSRTTAGIYEETFTVNDPDTVIQFYATGVSSIKVLQVYPDNDYFEGTTLAFNEDADRWVTYYSYIPEFMNKFINGFYTFKAGQLWEHNVNETRNNFYNQQYTSQIVFYVNLNPTQVKMFHSMREVSNKPWSVLEALIYPYYGKPNGQRSRLKKGRFRSLQGSWFADFLRDMEDPRFLSEEEALMNGAELTGNVMKITMENTDTTEVRLLSVDITVSPQEFTY